MCITGWLSCVHLLLHTACYPQSILGMWMVPNIISVFCVRFPMKVWWKMSEAQWYLSYMITGGWFLPLISFRWVPMATQTPHLLMDISPSQTLSNPPLSPKPSDTSPSTLQPSQQPNLTKISLQSQLSLGMQTAQEWGPEQLLRAQLLQDINKKEQ